MIALSSPSFRWLLVSTMAAYLGTGMQLTAIAWLAVSGSGGAITVGLVLAARMLPNLLFGLPAGTLADHADRERVLVWVRMAAVAPALGLAWLASQGTENVWPLVALSFATGSATVFDTPTRQALVMDTTPREVAPNAMALNATVSRLCTALGALATGLLVPQAGLAVCFLATAVVFGATALIGLPVKRSTHADDFAEIQADKRATFGQAITQAALLVFQVPGVRTLIVAAIACEVFGFSYMTAVPVFARDVLGAGAEGLGTLNAASSVGGATAVVILSLITAQVPREPLLGIVFVVYGASLLLLAPSTTLIAASVAMLLIGACAAAFDVLQQTLMQLAVPEEQRGRAVGLWVLGIGSAPIGNLEMGALVASIGAQAALLTNGILVLAAAVVLLFSAQAYRTGVPLRLR